MKFMDRLSRLLGRLPDSIRTEAERPQHQSEHTATSDIEIVAADDGSSGHKGASGSGDRSFAHPQPPDLVALYEAPHSEKTISSGEASSIDLGQKVTATGQCHSIFTNNPRSADNPRGSRASNEANVEMSERLSWRETEHDTSEFIADLAPSIVDADTTAGATSENDDIRLITQNFSPSCFHSASTGGRNANAAPWGGA